MTDQPIPREGSDTSLNALASLGSGPDIASPRSSTDSRSSSRNHNQLRVSQMSSGTPQHRQSMSEALRGPPGSPRSRRQPSLNSSAIQSLIDNPPPPKNVDPAFIGRDWQQISIGELVSPQDLRFVELDTGIEEATNTLIDSGAPVLLIRESPEKTAAVATFDYSDLNTYLLLAAGLALPQEETRASYDELAKKAREGEKIPLKDVKNVIGGQFSLSQPELSKTPWQPSKYSPDTHQPANEIENGVIHTWVDWAKTTGSLQHLRVLRFYNQALIKPSILQLLTELPNLQLIVIYQCQNFSHEFSRAKKPYSGQFEMQGWNVFRLDWALENTTEEEQAMQPLGPLLDVYRSTFNNRGRFSSTENQTHSSALERDVPIMEFGLPASDHSDRTVEIRAQYASKSIAILTRAPISDKKRQTPPQGNSNKSGKRIMKDKGARDMTDLLSDFL